MNLLSSLRATRAPIPSIPMSSPPGMKRRRLCSDQDLERMATPLTIVPAPQPLPRDPRSNVSSCGHVLAGHRYGSGKDCLDDVMVAGAPADIAFQFSAHGLLVQTFGMTVDHVDCGHDHAGRAKPALKPVMLFEGSLHRMQLVAECEPLDRQHFTAGSLSRQHRAGLYRLAIHMHDASAAR